VRTPTRSLAAVSLLALSGVAIAAGTWERNAAWLQDQIHACQNGAEEFACRYFPARVLKQLFGIGDFCTDDHCLLSHEIAAEISKGGYWTALGRASDQAILTQAQEMATGGLPVIAVQAAVDKGLIAIVMPGKLFPSQSWSMNVPLAVGARVDKPENSVYGKGLNFLFSEPAKVTLYAYK
jgi:hypothetical protein